MPRNGLSAQRCSIPTSATSRIISPARSLRIWATSIRYATSRASKPCSPPPRRSLIIFALLIASLAGIKLFIDARPELFRSAAQAAVFSWPAIGIHFAFPASAIIYPGGAIIVGIIYLLVPIPLLTWVVSSLLLRGGGRETTLWIVSALASAIEPITQDAPDPALSAPVNVLLFVSDYTLNLFQARFFIATGFVPAVLLRIVFYGIWRVAWGYAQGV